MRILCEVTFREVKAITETFRFFKTRNKNGAKFSAWMQTDIFDKSFPWLSKPFITVAKFSATDNKPHTASVPFPRKLITILNEEPL